MENYEQKYKEALEKARKRVATEPQDHTDAILKDIFPELKESEDEKIRKALLNEFIHLQSKGYKFAGLEGEDIIAWLEKQDEQKPVDIDIDVMVSEYANNKERGNEGCGKPVNCMIRAYRQGIEDILSRIQKPIEWSEEDEKIRSCIEMILTDATQRKFIDYNVTLKDCIDFFESLRPWSHWKPSDGQMDALADALSLAKNRGNENAFDLRTLYEQLQKL